MGIKQVDAIEDEITRGHDGPVTDLVIISRACEAMAEDNLDPVDVANAIHGALHKRGMLASE